MRKIKDNKTRKRKANKIIGEIQSVTEHTPLHALAIAVENIELGDSIVIKLWRARSNGTKNNRRR